MWHGPTAKMVAIGDPRLGDPVAAHGWRWRGAGKETA